MEKQGKQHKTTPADETLVKHDETAAPSADAPRGKRSDTDRLVDKWFRERILGSTLARHTPSYNALTVAVADLKDRLNRGKT